MGASCTEGSVNSMKGYYYLLQNGAESGPFTLQQIQAMWSSGAITARTQWRTEELVDWQPFSALEAILQPPPVIPSPSPPAIAPPTLARASIRKGSSFVGGGCAVQGLGLVCLILAAVTFPTVIGPIIFGIAGLWLLIYGGRQAQWFECSTCGGRLSHRRVKLCPHCNAHF
jgi:GYF domain 2